MKQAAMRLNVGGKLLTNLLGETLSTKDYNLTGELAILNDIKEATCFLSSDESEFKQNVEVCKGPKKRNPLWREWALPDYVNI